MSKGGALSTVSRKRLIGPSRFFLYRRRLVQTGCQFPLTVALLFIRFRLNADLCPPQPNTHRFFRNHAHKQRVFGLVSHHTSTFAPRGLAKMHDSLFLGAVLLSCIFLQHFTSLCFWVQYYFPATFSLPLLDAAASLPPRLPSRRGFLL